MGAKRTTLLVLSITRLTDAVEKRISPASVSKIDPQSGPWHSTLEQFMANEVEYESSTERMVIRQRIHPDHARTLREFAAQVIEHDAGTIVH